MALPGGYPTSGKKGHACPLKIPKETIERRCGVIATIELLGGRYKLLILRALLYRKGPQRFGTLRRELKGVSQKTLTRNLRELEQASLLTRTVFAEVPPRVEYELPSRAPSS